VPVVRGRGARLLRLPVGRDAARGGPAVGVLRAAGAAAGAGRGPPPFARQPLAPPLGMVPHLLLLGNRQAAQRRPAVARAHRPRSLLRERPAADLAGLVRAAASAALVPPRQLRRRAGGRAG